MLDSLFFPNSVAVIGASKIAGKVGHTTLRNLLQAGFSGTIIPVNPEVDQLLGLAVEAKLSNYPDKVDLALITVPADKVMAAVRDAVQKRVGSVVVVASGFKESGSEGSKLERELVEFCKKHGVSLLGPNCLGFVNTSIKLNASFAKRMPQAGKLAIFSQSGALCTAMMDAADQRKIGVSMAISIGNKADITEVEINFILHLDEFFTSCREFFRKGFSNLC